MIQVDGIPNRLLYFYQQHIIGAQPTEAEQCPMALLAKLPSIISSNRNLSAPIADCMYPYGAQTWQVFSLFQMVLPFRTFYNCVMA